MFRRHFIAAGTALLVLGQAAAAETLTVTASGSLNMRSGPGTGYRVVGQLARGTRVETLDSASGWVKVRSPSGTVGWVSSSYLGSLGGQGGAQGNAAPGEGRPNVRRRAVISRRRNPTPRAGRSRTGRASRRQTGQLRRAMAIRSGFRPVPATLTCAAARALATASCSGCRTARASPCWSAAAPGCGSGFRTAPAAGPMARI